MPTYVDRYTYYDKDDIVEILGIKEVKKWINNSYGIGKIKQNTSPELCIDLIWDHIYVNNSLVGETQYTLLMMVDLVYKSRKSEAEINQKVSHIVAQIFKSMPRLLYDNRGGCLPDMDVLNKKHLSYAQKKYYFQIPEIQAGMTAKFFAQLAGAFYIRPAFLSASSRAALFDAFFETGKLKDLIIESKGSLIEHFTLEQAARAQSLFSPEEAEHFFANHEPQHLSFSNKKMDGTLTLHPSIQAIPSDELHELDAAFRSSSEKIDKLVSAGTLQAQDPQTRLRTSFLNLKSSLNENFTIYEYSSERRIVKTKQCHPDLRRANENANKFEHKLFRPGLDRYAQESDVQEIRTMTSAILRAIDLHRYIQAGDKAACQAALQELQEEAATLTEHTTPRLRKFGLTLLKIALCLSIIAGLLFASAGLGVGTTLIALPLVMKTNLGFIMMALAGLSAVTGLGGAYLFFKHNQPECVGNALEALAEDAQAIVHTLR